MMQDQKKIIIKALLEKDILVTEQILEILPDDFNIEEFYTDYYTKTEDEQQLIKDIKNYLNKNIEQKNNTIQITDEIQNPIERKVKIITSYKDEPKKRSINDFISYYNKRYQQIKKMLLNRMELSGAISINKISTRNDNEPIALVVIISEKTITKNNNLVIKAEDPTGEITIIINKNRPETMELAKTLVLDEIIGVIGTVKNKTLYANTLFLPDIPLSKELKKAPIEEYALFISDIHVGSNFFLGEQFNKFINFLNGNIVNNQYKELVPKIKYVFMMGDLVDGVGIYPGQEKELKITDIYEQYTEFSRLISKISKNISLIICPGNHDAVRLCEPQPPLTKVIAKALYEFENVFLVSNPAMVNIAATATFPGLDVLLYHGYSFDYYISNIDEIRNNGGYDRADLIMKFLLQKRHLAPTHASTLFIPEIEHDPLVISKIPDIFCTGHIHKVSASNYRNITLVSGSCWQDTTKFQEKMGHHPEPCRVPMINLQTREVRILKF